MLFPEVIEVCRLCSKGETLRNVFDIVLDGCEDLSKLVYVAVGVEVR